MLAEPTLKLPTLALPTLPKPILPKPRLNGAWTAASRKNPASSLPTLPTPETCAGTPRPVLNAPETVSPRLAKPDCSAPRFCTPELPDPTLRKPEVRAAKLPNPETLPSPELKKPEDGLVVVFPKPGVAGMSMIGTSTGPISPVACRRNVAGPISKESTGPVMLICGMVIGPRYSKSIPITVTDCRGMTKLAMDLGPMSSVNGMSRL
ncbi:hypothetical protein DE4381_02855 [Mycobacterium marinum]|nr:hypothetical protein DE4381_02855 [Mycobacterium marinum]